MKKNIVIILVSQILIFYAAFINRFPEGFFFTGGDCVQYFNFDRVFSAFKYTWFDLVDGNGLALQYFSYSLYYYALSFISNLFSLNYSEQGFLYYFLFFFLSFWSFYISTSFFSRNMGVVYKTVFSLLYTFNLYTLSLFCYTWGYTPFPLSYITFPMIMGLTYMFFSNTENTNYKLIGGLSVVFFLQNIPNGNLPFFISLNLFIFAFIILLYIFNYKSISFLTFAKRITVFYMINILCSAWTVIPQIPEMLYLIGDYKASNTYFDLKAWVLWLSVPFMDLFFVAQNMANFASKVSPLVYLGIVFFIVPFYAFLKKKPNKATLIFCILLILNFFLTNKGKGILDTDTIWLLFNNPILSSIRNFEKTLIFLPFILLTFFLLAINNDFKKYKFLLTFFFICAMLSVYPFFKGNILKDYAFVLDEGNKDYTTSEYSYLVKMPDEYLNLSEQLNLRKKDFKLMSAPYSVINSFSWVNYPKWKVVSLDPTLQLFNHPVIQMNASLAFGNWVYGKVWNEQENTESTWLPKLMALMNVDYIIYHKDIRKDFYKNTKGKMDYYERLKKIKKIEENDYFTLYELNKKLPVIYTPQSVLVNDKDKELLPDILSLNIPQRNAVYFYGQNKGKDNSLFLSNTGGSTKKSIIYYGNSKSSVDYKFTSLYKYNVENLPIIEYKKINPSKYRLRIHSAKTTFPIVFSDSYRHAWKAYVKPYKNSLIKLEKEYKIFDKNDHRQASLDDVKLYIGQGIISSLGNHKSKTTKHKKWLDQKHIVDYEEKFNYDFISKIESGTIQNNNLPDGHVLETLLCQTSLNKLCKNISDEKHLKVNGFSNSWVIDPKEICENSSSFCVKNNDGSYEIEIVIEYSPQKMHYITLMISLISIGICVSVSCFTRLFSKKKDS